VRRLLLSPALAVLIVLLLAGGALAMAGRDRTWLSGIGHWLRARGEQPGAPAPHPAIRPPRAEAPAIAASPAATNEAAPTPPTPAIAPSEAPIPAARAVDRPSHTLEPSHARRARVALAPTRDDRVRGPAAKLPARPEVPSEEPAPPALVQPPPAAPQAETSSAPAATRATLPASPAPERTTPPAAAHVPVPVAEANPIVAESRSFASALERWHRDQDAGAALAMLDVQERRFPSGQLGLEARLLRVEILLASRRESDALALLDHMGIAGVPRARELRTVRGELRIKLGRCADGRADLNAVLAAGTADPLAQRARRAIAACP
jgi:hypothetical protein